MALSVLPRPLSMLSHTGYGLLVWGWGRGGGMDGRRGVEGEENERRAMGKKRIREERIR
jgi:hypothetical protein